ncbi:C25 family cysteine peptidase [Chitinophaga barathri]|nr:C25 family cysteine peptidase [Chitinophaga barathri]
MKTDLHCLPGGNNPVETISFTIVISPQQVKTEETPFGVRYSLGKDYKVTSAPGTPSFPSRIVQVALPLDATDITVTAESLCSRRLSEKPVFIMPVPEYRIAAKGSGGHRPDGDRLETIRSRALQQTEDDRQSAPLMQGPLIRPDAEAYAKTFEQPPALASLISIVEVGGNRITNISISPISLEGYIPVLHEQISVRVVFRKGEEKTPLRHTTYRVLPQDRKAQASLFKSLKDSVLNPYGVIDLTSKVGLYLGNYDYIVITDNHRWDSTRISPAEPVGNMVEAFTRLTQWKREKGLRAAVITITDIVNGVYGDFKTGANDLQEVIRNFLKFARGTWGTTWVLLGGDIEIVPVRKTAGEILGEVSEQTKNNPPANRESFWTGSFMKLRVTALGDWWNIHDTYLELTSRTNGRRIPRKTPFGIFTKPVYPFRISTAKISSLAFSFFETPEAFRKRLGWHFCTDETYETFSADPTDFVRVDGPESVIRVPLRFHYTWNTIPTDFYYSSLFGPGYGLAGRHDWDLNNNGIYGQYEGANSFDPINWNADVVVGRAPVSTPAEAETFVNKVLDYEKIIGPIGIRFYSAYLGKMLLAADNWDGSPVFSPTVSNPPEVGRFFSDAANGRAILQLATDAPKSFSWQLVTWISNADVRVLPYNLNAGRGNKGWYYARSAADLSPSVFTLHMPWGDVHNIPNVSDTIVVYGDAAEISPLWYMLDALAADGSMTDQELLRAQVDAELPVIKHFNRLYKDVQSLSTAGAVPPQRLTYERLEAALNEGQHFVSLSGHGNQWGCCDLGTGMAASLTNGPRTFIAYADSCLTNGFDESDAMGEALVKNPNGGAVAYIGSTRFSWIGLGDDVQRAFFNELTRTRHLGLLHNSRLRFAQNHPGNHYYKWCVLALNLLGDPEMEVWKRSPDPFRLEYIPLEKDLRIRVLYETDLTRHAVREAEVVAYAGDNILTVTANAEGYFDLPNELAESGNLRLRVSIPDGLSRMVSGEELKKKMEQFRRPEIEEVPVENLQDGFSCMQTAAVKQGNGHINQQDHITVEL